MKKIHILFAAAVMCASASAAAEDFNSDVVVSLRIDDPVMQVNGIGIEIDEGRGTSPVVRNDRTLVPIRAIIEAFGGAVEWDGNTQSVLLNMENDSIRLTIDSSTAYFNNEEKTLDTAPVIINERTMLPIRFIAESFNLGVAWDGGSQTVSIIRNSFDDEEYQSLMNVLPAYSGEPYVQINNNVPFFKDYEIINGSFEYYSSLDELDRCDVCMASIAKDIMPTGERESISSVTPTGWINKSYDNVDGGYLYNRCHLIGYQLTGENANERNLITGTRYLNIGGMLPFENMVDDYVESTGNHVMYRSTPVFTADNLVADGVLIEGYSVEDNGEGVSFCVYCYNVQPDVTIDYSTGESFVTVSTDNTLVNPEVPENSSGDSTESSDGNIAQPEPENTGNKIYRTPSGKRYHFDPDCGGKNGYETTLEDAQSAGLTPCQKCAG